LNGKATLKDADGTCYNLGASDTSNGHAMRRDKSETSKDLSNGGLTVLYDGGDDCDQDNLKYSLSIEMYCADDN
jgi:hypothetical protein